MNFRKILFFTVLISCFQNINCYAKTISGTFYKLNGKGCSITCNTDYISFGNYELHYVGTNDEFYYYITRKENNKVYTLAELVISQNVAFPSETYESSSLDINISKINDNNILFECVSSVGLLSSTNNYLDARTILNTGCSYNDSYDGDTFYSDYYNKFNQPNYSKFYGTLTGQFKNDKCYLSFDSYNTKLSIQNKSGNNQYYKLSKPGITWNPLNTSNLISDDTQLNINESSPFDYNLQATLCTGNKKMTSNSSYSWSFIISSDDMYSLSAKPKYTKIGDNTPVEFEINVSGEDDNYINIVDCNTNNTLFNRVLSLLDSNNISFNVSEGSHNLQCILYSKDGIELLKSNIYNVNKWNILQRTYNEAMDKGINDKVIVLFDDDRNIENNIANNTIIQKIKQENANLYLSKPTTNGLLEQLLY